MVRAYGPIAKSANTDGSDTYVRRTAEAKFHTTFLWTGGPFAKRSVASGALAFDVSVDVAYAVPQWERSGPLRTSDNP